MVERPRLPSLLLENLEPGREDDLVIARSHDCAVFTDIDLSGERLNDRDLVECLVSGARLDDASLRGSRMRETRWERCEGTTVDLSGTELREVEFVGCRFGALEIFDVKARMVHVEDCRLGYVNLRGAELVDITLSGCVIADLDLGGAEIDRLALPNCRVDRLILSGATLRDADLRGAEFSEITGIEALRGATVSAEQLHDLAPLLADHLGLEIG